MYQTNVFSIFFENFVSYWLLLAEKKENIFFLIQFIFCNNFYSKEIMKT